MACDITKGKNLLACKDAVSGLKAIYIANYEDYQFVTSSTDAGHLLTDLGNLTDVYKFELKNSGNTFAQDITSSRDNGTTFFNQTLNFVLTKLSAEMEFQIKMLAWGRPQIFVEANSGDIFLMGEKHGCEVSGKSEVQGTMDSLNGYTMTAIAMEKEPIWYLTGSMSTALIQLVATASVAG
jgi:hypothetical protein